MGTTAAVLGLAAALALALPPGPAAAADGEARPEGEERPRIEVAFVLDTTGSMGGLIETAKRKIWAIANEVVRARPAPEVRMGLVAYRDRGDAYVTRVTDLDGDLDRVYGELSGLQAAGGGDGPESVNEALRDAVTKLSWSRGDRVLRVVFLVGDAPPHMDYEQDVPYPRTCEAAARAGIVINTLRCGGDPATEKVWREIASLAEGSYASIPQEGAEAVPTPFDERLAALGERVGATYVGYGHRDDRAKAAAKMRRAEETAREAGSASAPSAVAADRAGTFALRETLDGTDLVGLVGGGKVRVEDLESDRLPDALKDLSPEARKARIEELVRERESLRKEMAALQGKRAAFLAEAARRGAAAGRSAFDLEVSKALRAQGAKRGFTFPE